MMQNIYFYIVDKQVHKVSIQNTIFKIVQYI